MRVREFADKTLLLKAEPGEDILAAATKVLDERRIFAGGFNAIGAVEEAEIGFWDPKLRQYLKEVVKGSLEILALNGNVSRVDEHAFIHAHVVLGDRSMNCRGGHCFRAIAEPTCELVLRPLEGAVERRMDEACGLRLWRL